MGARIALVPVLAAPIALAVVIFRPSVLVAGMLSEVVPGDSMDTTHAATAIVASPAWDLAVAISVVAVEVSAAAASAGVVASVVAAAASAGVAVVVEVAAVVEGNCCES